jgi:TP901 family phage tail tape measure protein
MADTTLRFVLVADTTQFNAKMKAAISGLATVGTKGEKSMKKVTRGTGTLMNMLTRARGVILSVGVSLATIGAVRAFAQMAGEAMEFNQAFIGVRKTVDASEAEFKALYTQFRNLSTEIPFTAAELSKIGQIAGQLGVQAKDIAAFTKVVAELSVAAEDLDAEQAAFSLARLTKIMGDGINEASNMSSAIVALGNNFSTTEGEITEMALRMGAAGRVIGLTAPEVLGLATTLTQLGIKAQAGGTALSKAFIQMKKAVEEGGKTLEGFAKVAGTTAEEFAQQFRTDPVRAITEFIEGMGQIVASGGPAFQMLEELGLSNIRVQRAMLSTASAASETRKAIALATKSYRENSAATKEAEKFYESWQNRLKVVKNQLSAVVSMMVESFMPDMISGLGRVTEAFDDYRRAVERVHEEMVTEGKAAGTVQVGVMDRVGAGVQSLTIWYYRLTEALIIARHESDALMWANRLRVAQGQGDTEGIEKFTQALQQAEFYAEVHRRRLEALVEEQYDFTRAVEGGMEKLKKWGLDNEKTAKSIQLLGQMFGATGSEMRELITISAESYARLVQQKDAIVDLRIAADEGKISQEQFKEVLYKVAEGTLTAAVALESYEINAEKMKVMSEAAREAQEKLEKELKKMREELDKSAHGADVLAKRMDDFEKAGHSAEILVATFGGALEELAEKQNQSGKEISASAAKWLQQKAVWERAIPVLDDLDQQLIGTGKSFRNLSPTIEDTAEAMEHIDKIFKKALKEIDENADPTLKALVERMQNLKEEIADLATSHENLGILIEHLEEMGITGPQAAKLLETDIKKLVKAFEILGIAVPENLQQWLAWVEQMDKAEKEAKRVAGIIDGVITRAFNDFTKTIADAIVDWKGFWSGLVDVAKSFAKSLIRVLLTEMFNPMMGIVKSIGQALSGALFGGGFGKGKGSFFSNVAGLFTGGGAAGGIREVAGVGTGGGLAGKAGMGGSAGLGAMSTSFATMKLNAIAAGEAIWKFVTMTTALGPLGAVIGGVAAGVYGLYIWLRKTTRKAGRRICQRFWRNPNFRANVERFC